MKRMLKIFLLIVCVASYAGAQQFIEVSIKDVSRLALENNFDIQLARYDAYIAKTQEGVARGMYDTFFEADIGYRDNQRKQPTVFSGTKTQENDYTLALKKKLPTGTDVEISLDNARQSTNSAFTTSPVTHDSTLEATVTQSLGKNFFGIQDRGAVKLTLLDIEHSEYTSLQKIETSLADVQKAYWNLVLEYERVGIQEEMVAMARKLYDLQKEKLKDGLVELPDAIAAEANYEKRKNALMLMRNALKSRKNTLLLELNSDLETADIFPLDKLDVGALELSLEEALKKAFLNRMDYKSVKNLIEQKNINLTMKKNNIFPELNLTASLANNGLGDHFKESVSNITSEDNPNYFIGLSVSFPLENRKARAQLEEAQLQKAKILIDLKYVERKISVEINDAVRNAKVLREYAFNEENVALLEEKKLEEELKRFNRGRSSTDTVIRFQEDVIEARLDAALAKYNYQTALIDLEQTQSSLLKEYWDESGDRL